MKAKVIKHKPFLDAKQGVMVTGVSSVDRKNWGRERNIFPMTTLLQLGLYRRIPECGKTPL